jgi:tRNA dimethylallyltransferase
MQGLGYKELLSFFRGETSLPDAVELIKQRTRNYAKRQLTWFRADKRIRWLPADEDHFPDVNELLAALEE